MLIDTHAHIYAEEFETDRDIVIRRAIDEGVEKIFIPNVDSDSIEPLLELVDAHPQTCYPMIGIHPTSVNADYERELAMVKHWLQKRKFIAVGEIGMDLYWDKTFEEEQKLVFAQQIKWAKQYGLPIAIHNRDAFAETMTVLRANHFSELKGVFHSFSGSVEEATQVIELGFKIGVSGVVTFKNAGMDKVIAEIPLEHLVLETDAPYLTPVPFRGKRNESAYVRNIAQKIAELHQIDIHTVEEITTANALKTFSI
ncbi:MAG: TatD family hydrolase [Mangrovibacterium sp.]